MPEFVAPIVDVDLLARYDKSGPRYTSYPTAPQFSESFTGGDWLEAIEASNRAPEASPLSLYFHLPFCESVCLFCGCNVTFTRDRNRPTPYTERLVHEMDCLAGGVPRTRAVKQLHWGGGTPTFFAPEELGRLFDAIRERFAFAPDAEIGLEVDPRETRREHLEVLAGRGFNRLSMGVQDFDPAVQKAVNRIQPWELTRDTIEAGRALGFESISVDLIYGLPLQTEQSFAQTIERVIGLNPDRIALFNFAYLPEMIKHQKALKPEQMPSASVKVQILKHAIERFGVAGYRYIGMDHFAKPTDPMCVAQDNGTLYRNFQGYTTHAGCDLLAFGVSAIGSVGRCYAQNKKEIRAYQQAIDAGEPAVHRGLRMTDEDLLRREVIMRLMCDFALDEGAIGRQFGIVFSDHFGPELDTLAGLAADGLVTREAGRIAVTPVGRLLIRNIAMIFDAYLQRRPEVRFSRTV